MRLVIGDSNRILGEALGVVLRSLEHEVVAVASRAGDCVRAVAAGKPDVCLLDVRLPRLEDGLRAVREIRGERPATAVVVLSDPGDQRAWSQASKLGIAGLLTRDRSVAQIVAALEEVMGGAVVFDQGPWRKPPGTTVTADLTPREAEVLERMTAGQDTRRMAHEMNVTVSTLRTYVKNVLSKLGVHSRLEAVALASQRPARPADGETCLLTPREREVLMYLAAGTGRRDMAACLQMSPNTVRTHLQNLMGKLGVHSALEAVALARSQGS